jgi:hypothetical protein
MKDRSTPVREKSSRFRGDLRSPSVAEGAPNLSERPRKKEQMRKLIATLATALALTGVGLATYTTTSDTHDTALYPRQSNLKVLMSSARL